MLDPELIILDEPATGLDFLAREQLLETINVLAKQKNGPAIIYVTHHLEEILPVFSHSLLLKKGTVFAKGKTEEMMTSEKLSQFFELAVKVIWNNQRPLLAKA